jgi:flagellar hook-length control protein FliK
VVSVTSEVSANASFQSAAARSARPDSEPSAGNDSFATLVDSNTAASRNDNRTQDPAPTPRRSDDSQTASNNRSRDNAAASDRADKAARNDSNDRDAAAKAGDGKARDDSKVDSNADADTKAATTRRGKSKADAAKSDNAKSDEATQASSGDTSPATDQTGTAQDGTAVVTADAVAAAIPAVAAPAAAASTTPATDKATAPLAIAAAAIAASASLAAETAPSVPAAEGTDGTTTATTSAATANAAPADGAKTGAQGGVGQAVNAQATFADMAVTTGIAQAASVAAATPAATKPAVQIKNPDLARKGATTVVEQAGVTDTTASATPAADTIVPAATTPTEAAGKPKSENGIVDAVKADASGNSITPPAANAQAHAHLGAPDIGLTPTNSSGNGLQAASTIQAQQPAAAAATPAAATQLTAAAATSAPVPVSGLAMEIAASAKSGKTRFEIRLDPAELGRIDVRIDVDRHGQVTSHLTVERPETLSMLRQDANQLQRALDNAGLSTGNGGLQFSLRDQSSQGQNDGNQSNPNAHRIVVSEEDSVPAAVAGRSYGRMLGASGGVDIRI